MSSDFAVVLSRFRALSDFANAEEDEIKEATLGEGPHLVFSLEVDDYRSEPRPCKAAMKAFLEALPVSNVFALTALMYSGRDGEVDPVDYWSDLKSSIPTKEHAVRALVEKSPRMEYIDTALSALPASLRLGDIPALVARA